MNCMKCGREIREGQVFCESCLRTMKDFPVKSGTPVLLPPRPAPVVVKKVPHTKPILTAEEKIFQLRRTVRRLSLALAVVILALVFSVYLLWDIADPDISGGIIGQNYSTIGTQSPTD